MTKQELYSEELRKIKGADNIIEYLKENSNLPGKRGNLELAHAFAQHGSKTMFNKLLKNTPETAPANTPEEFLAFCGTLGWGRLLAEHDENAEKKLRKLANDPRWRVREAVAQAMQMLGDKNMRALIRMLIHWNKCTFLEQRAMAAALCEPRLLSDFNNVNKVFAILMNIAEGIPRLSPEEKKSDEFKALRKALGYCFSVAIAAHPGEGKRNFEKLLEYDDKDIRWIMKENLKKNRLVKTDEPWVVFMKSRIKELEDGS